MIQPLWYHKVASSRPVYYSILEPFGQRSHCTSIKFPLHKPSEETYYCSRLYCILNQTKNIKYVVISRWYLIKWTIVSWLDGSTWWHKVNMCFFADMRMHYITTYILCKWVSAESTFSVSCSISLVEWWKVGTQPLPVGQCFAACFCY